MMEYNGYLANVEFDDGAATFHGEVINTRDVITFQGETVRKLTKAFELAKIAKMGPAPHQQAEAAATDPQTATG